MKVQLPHPTPKEKERRKISLGGGHLVKFMKTPTIWHENHIMLIAADQLGGLILLNCYMLACYNA